MLQDRRFVTEGAAAAQLQAEFTPIVTCGSPATLTVRLTRPDAALRGAGGTDGPAPVDGELTVTVVPRGLRFLVGARRSRRLRLPETGSAQARFTMLATDLGPAEVTVIVRRDGGLPLATVRLTTEVVTNDDHDQAGLARATSPVGDVDAALAGRPTLRIDEEFARGRSILHASLSVGGEAHRFRIRIADKAALVRETRASMAGAREDAGRLPEADRPGAVEERLREIGAGLADRLLDRRARELLWAHRDELDGVVLQTTGETELPWELLVVRRPGDAPAGQHRFLGEHGLTRWLADVAPPSAVRLPAVASGDAGRRPATTIGSASIVALGVGEDGANGSGPADAMRNGAGVVVSCGGGSGARRPSPFLEAFSAELAGGAPLDRASLRAREVARRAGEACALAYAVYGHPDARANAG